MYFRSFSGGAKTSWWLLDTVYNVGVGRGLGAVVVAVVVVIA